MSKSKPYNFSSLTFARTELPGFLIVSISVDCRISSLKYLKRTREIIPTEIKKKKKLDAHLTILKHLKY